MFWPRRERVPQPLPLNQMYRLAMHFKASKCPAVVVLHVCFSYPVVFVRCSIRFKLNQMSPVVVLAHVARLSQRKVVLLLRFGVVAICSWSASVNFLSVSYCQSVVRKV